MDLRRLLTKLSPAGFSAGPLGLFLVTTLALAGWLGYQAMDAAASHRRTAEAVLQKYAQMAATAFTSDANNDLDDVLDDIFDPVTEWGVEDGEDWSVTLGWAIPRALEEEECPCKRFRPLALIRMDEQTGVLEAVPDTLSSRVRKLIGDRLRNETGQRGPGRNRRTGLVVSRPDDRFPSPVVIAYSYPGTDRDNDDDGATFAVVIEARALGDLFKVWYDENELLPPPLAEDVPNDSLMTLSVLSSSGDPIFSSPVEYSTELAGKSSLEREFANLEVVAAIRPESASELIIGGLPNSRLPLLAALLVLTLGVGLATLVLLRRERDFQHLREDFVSGVSHQLRTPLAQIRMFAELQESGKLVAPEDQRRAVSVIHRESRRLTHLVENILQFSQMKRAPGQGMPKEQLDLAEALAEGADAVMPLLHDRGMHLDIRADRGLAVSANRDAITRMVVNLLDNAVKYGPRGQTVTISTERENGSVRLAVSDQGPGIPAIDRDRVWKPYRRLERDVKARIPGTGIGLSVVSELAALHQGRVWVEEAHGGGASFVVELPLLSGNGVKGHG